MLVDNAVVLPLWLYATYNIFKMACTLWIAVILYNRITDKHERNTPMNKILVMGFLVCLIDSLASAYAIHNGTLGGFINGTSMNFLTYASSVALRLTLLLGIRLVVSLENTKLGVQGGVDWIYDKFGI